MRFLGLFFIWLLVFAVCWPVALLGLIALPFLWLLALPFRVVGVVLEALISFLKAVLFLPSRVLGGGPARG